MNRHPGDDLHRKLAALATQPQISVPSLGGTLPPPTRFGRYVFAGEIGAGGMSVVYAARDPELDRTVAVKVLRDDGPACAQQLLRREAQAMARVAHPNVITIHDVGVWDGRMFIAMEYVEGATLARWITAQRSQREILDVYLAAGRGLAAAHAAGIVHRDFKPENVLIGRDGRVRVGDFGLSYMPGAASQARTSCDQVASAKPAADVSMESMGDPACVSSSVAAQSKATKLPGPSDSAVLLGTRHYMAIGRGGPRLPTGGAHSCSIAAFSYSASSPTASRQRGRCATNNRLAWSECGCRYLFMSKFYREYWQFTRGGSMSNATRISLCVWMFTTGCMLDSADVPTELQPAATQALAANECSNEQDCVASAAHDDSFDVPTGDGCGRADFVDFGPGAPGGGNNDDYIVIHDFCGDGHGVKVWAWLNGGSVNNDVGRYNSNGLVGDPVYWDPFKPFGNVIPGDSVRIKVCLADSATANASNSWSCNERTHVSVDG